MAHKEKYGHVSTPTPNPDNVPFPVTEDTPDLDRDFGPGEAAIQERKDRVKGAE